MHEFFQYFNDFETTDSVEWLINDKSGATWEEISCGLISEQPNIPADAWG